MSVTNPRYEKLEQATDEARRHLHPPADPVLGTGERHPGESGTVYASFERNGTAAEVEALAPIWRRRLEQAGVRMGIVTTSTMTSVGPDGQTVRAWIEEADLLKLAALGDVCARDPEAGVVCTEDVNAGPREQAAESDLDERTKRA